MAISVFAICMSVMLGALHKSKGISLCWQPNWSGPWTIVQLPGEVNCKLQKSTGKEPKLFMRIN